MFVLNRRPNLLVFFPVGVFVTFGTEKYFLEMVSQIKVRLFHIEIVFRKCSK